MTMLLLDSMLMRALARSDFIKDSVCLKRRAALGVWTIAFVCLLAPLTTPAWALDIVRDGKPVARIVYADDADTYTRTAAKWLQTYVSRATQATLAIVKEGSDPGGGVRICVGATRAAAAAGIRADNIPADGGRLVVRGDTLFVLGHDEGAAGTMAIQGAKGTSRAVTMFLEQFCGIRWLAPTTIGEYVPRRSSITVPADLDQTFVPAFVFAIGRTVYPNNTPAGAANNFRRTVRLYAVGGHTWPKWVPASKYFTTHPEYFALIDGRRSGEGNNLCTTNPDVKRLLVEAIRAKFDEGYDWVELGQSDSYDRCECGPCEASDDYQPFRSTDEYIYQTLRDHPCDRVFLLHRAVAEECLQSHPTKKILLLGYAPTLQPPKAFNQFPTNVFVELASEDPRILTAWEGRTAGRTAYVYYWGIYHALGPGPKYTASQVATSLRYLRDNGIIGIYFGGIGECWGLEGHTYYACAKLLGNPDLDPASLTREYCEGLFGAASTAMMDFFRLLDQQVQLYAPIRLDRNADQSPQYAYLTLYPEAILDQLEELLSRAEAAADSAQSRDWIRLSRVSFDYVKLTARAFHAYRAFQAKPSGVTLSALRAVTQAWHAHRQMILNLPSTETDRWFPEHDEWLRFFASNGTGRAHLGEPFDLDFNVLSAQYPEQPAQLRVTAP